MNSVSEMEHPRGRSDVIFRPLDDSWVLFDPRPEQLHVLNLSAAIIWAHLDGETSLDEIAEAVGAGFDPPMPTARVMPDVLAVLERFRASGLLEPTLHP